MCSDLPRQPPRDVGAVTMTRALFPLLLLSVGCASGDDTAPDDDTPETDDSVETDTEPVDTDLPPESLPLSVCINELMASNRGSFETDGESPDWIELHNPETAPLALDGWTIADSSGDPVALDGLSVPAEGYLLLFASDALSGPAWLGFGLGSDGDALTLRAPDGRSVSLRFPQSVGDMAYARTEDCCQGDCWRAHSYGTPGATNARP